MANPNAIIPLLFIVIWTTHFQAIIVHGKRHCFFTRKFTVHVTNKLPPKSDPLKLHCGSKDDDLGFHTLSPNQSFSWGFCENFVPNTLFFCHIWWGYNKDIGFESFNFEFHDGCIPDGSQCFWEPVRSSTRPEDNPSGSSKANWSIHGRRTRDFRSLGSQSVMNFIRF
ncbi:Plant self-incompatibility protein S1 family [Striga hermonthica]|uniref:S-protein homolog n=1 Tax=Striga hermonthica TaxID=68872 RepID=A0A9N7RGU4_STRHE|nr:Plant self-incompatibility protein S1 family [Striga hermonthica]